MEEVIPLASSSSLNHVFIQLINHIRACQDVIHSSVTDYNIAVELSKNSPKGNKSLALCFKKTDWNAVQNKVATRIILLTLIGCMIV